MRRVDAYNDEQKLAAWLATSQVFPPDEVKSIFEAQSMKIPVFTDFFESRSSIIQALDNLKRQIRDAHGYDIYFWLEAGFITTLLAAVARKGTKQDVEEYIIPYRHDLENAKLTVPQKDEVVALIKTITNADETKLNRVIPRINELMRIYARQQDDIDPKGEDINILLQLLTTIKFISLFLIVGSFVLVVAANWPIYYFPIIVIAIILTFVVVGAFVIQSDKNFSEKGFLDLMKLILGAIPFLFKRPS